MWLSSVSTRGEDTWLAGELAAELAELNASTSGQPLIGEPEVLSEQEYWDWLDAEDKYPAAGLSAIERYEFECWEAESRDQAERAMLELRAPAWLNLPPGADLAAALERLRPSVEDPAGLIEAIRACDRLTAWTEAVKTEAIARFYRHREHEAETGVTLGHDPATDQVTGKPLDPLRSAAAELAAALKLAPSTVGSRIETAQRLTGPLAATLAAMRQGRISLGKAVAIADATTALPADQQTLVQDRVLPRAPEQTQANLRASLRRAVAKVDPRDHTRRHRDALAERACRITPLPDGMAGIWITHTADNIQAAYTALQALADLAKTPDDARTAEQRRADAAMDVFGHLLAAGTDWLNRPLPAKHRRRPHIEVLVPASTLLGLTDDPAELTGHGPIPADLARRIAADGTWRRLLTDPATGIVLEAATSRHDPGAQVTETLLARHPTCAWIGCNRTARDCDRDAG